MSKPLRFPSSSLRARLMLLVGLAALPALALTAYQGGQVRQRARSGALADALRLAHLAAAYQRGYDTGLLPQTAARIGLPVGAALSLLDADGVVVARYPDDEGWTGKLMPDPALLQARSASQRSALESTTTDGIKWLTGMIPLADALLPAPADNDVLADMWVTASIPAALAYASAQQDILQRLAALGLIILLALAAAWFGGDVVIVRPIRRLVQAAQRVAAGDLEARSGLAGEHDELGELARTFDHMADELQAREQERERVEHELRKRAAELAALQATVLDIAAWRTPSSVDAPAPSAGSAALARMDDGAQPELHALLSTIVERAAGLLQAPASGLYLCDPDRRELRLVVGRNVQRDYSGAVLKYGEGVAGRVALTGKPMIVQDYRTWPGRAPTFADDDSFASVLCAPLVWQGEVIGALNVGNRPDDQPFTAVDAELLSLFASHAAIAVQNSRLNGALRQELVERERREAALLESEGSCRVLFGAAQRQAQELALLDQVRSALARELDPAVVYRTVVEAVASTFGYTQVSLYLLRDDVLHLQHQVGYTHVVERIPVHSGITGRVARTGEPVLIADVRSDPDFLGVIEGITSEVCVPLHDGARVSGVLNVESVQGVVLTEADLRLMEALSEHIEVALARARLYAEARESEERYRRLFEDSPISLWEEDLSQVKRDLDRLRAFGVGDLSAYFDQQPGAVQELLAKIRVVDVNQATVRLYQAESKEELVAGLANIIAPAGLAAAKEHLVHIAAGNTRWRGEVANQTMTGELRLLDITWQVFPGCEESWSRAVASAIDITEERRAIEESRRLESQLRQAQKMEALGMLAGGVAHDFNNLLTVILGNAEMALEGVDKGTALHKELSLIERTTRRAAELTQQLLSFSRRRVLQSQLVDVNALVGEFSAMLRRVLGAHIELVLDLPPLPVQTFADAGALEQVLMNLAVNAQDAMPSGGRLTIATAVVHGMPASPRLAQGQGTAREPVGGVARGNGGANGSYIRISIADTGVGMDETTRAHLFEPFFTTKARGKGTGLGLSVAYGIVTQHDGWIEVDSRQGKGTCFRVYLPAHATAAPPRAKDEAGPVAGGRERILLAEDEELVRELAQRILESVGYTVLTVADGAEALAVFADQGERIQLVILDAIMPRMTGLQVLEAIRQVRDVPVLFITGYSADMAGLPGDATMGLHVLRKPFTSQDLVRMVREVLEAGTAK